MMYTFDVRTIEIPGTVIGEPVHNPAGMDRPIMTQEIHNILFRASRNSG